MSEMIEINNDYMDILLWLGCEILKSNGKDSKLFKNYLETFNTYRAMAIEICCEANAVAGEAVWGVTEDNKIVREEKSKDVKTYRYLN